ncbi:MAG TPA: class I SAM-dependent methyltransferase [Candidatus Saccharimonadia bacterium]|nr:class I SAM-dependent methyltransferase [Candidatus Saccharimonadia bacterium]
MLLIAIVVLVLLLVAAIAITVHLVVSVFNSFTTALPVPTPYSTISDIVDALSLPTTGVYVEPGCGDARVLAAVLRAQPGLRAVGVENNPLSLLKSWLAVRGCARLVSGDLMKMRFHSVDRVFTYLSPRLMSALETRFQDELPKGARLVSLQFPLPHKQPAAEIILTGGRPHAKKLFVYDY